MRDAGVPRREPGPWWRPFATSRACCFARAREVPWIAWRRIAPDLTARRISARVTASAVLDAGLRRPTPGGRLQAALKGLLDAGLDVPHRDEGFPSADRLNGKHLPQPLPQPLEMYKQKLPTLSAQAEAS